MVDGAGVAPQLMVVAAGALITGKAAGCTVMVLEPCMVLPHASVNDQVSVSVPPQPVMVPDRTALTVPSMRHGPLAEFE